MIQLFISNAYAQATATAATSGGMMQFAPIAIVMAIFYFLMIRPHKKQLEEEQKTIDALAKGAEIYTKSGILGTVVGITDKVLTLEVSDGVKIKVLKSQIGGLTAKIFEKKED
jgi:preprotein translocase subunit YajC